MLTTYAGGGCTGLVGHTLLVLIACAPHDELVGAMWQPVLGGDLPTLVTTLTSRGVAGLPPFAIAQTRGDEVVVLVRGRIRVDAYRDGDLLESMTADTVTTWRELSFVEADRVVLADERQGTSGPPLPILGGVVAAAMIERQVRTQVTPQMAAQVSVPDPARPEQGQQGQQPGHEDTWSEPPSGSWDEPPGRGANEPPGHGLDEPPIRGAKAPPTQTWVEPSTSLPAAGGMLDRLFSDDEIDPRAAKPAVAMPVIAALGEIRFESPHGGGEIMARPGHRAGALVPAVRCPQLHLNPPATPACRECHVPIVSGQVPERVPQPTVGWLRRIDTNERWPISRAVTLLGRQPGPQARLDLLSIVVGGVSDAVADLHAEVILDGWRIEVADRSERGTFVINPGGRKERLVPGTTARLMLGGRIILADEVTFLLEVN